MAQPARVGEKVHEQFTSLMSLLLDGVATEEERFELARHLDECAACAAVWEDWQTVDRLLSTTPSVAPSRDLAAELALRLHGQEQAEPGAGWYTLGLLAFGLLSLAMSCVAIAELHWRRRLR